MVQRLLRLVHFHGYTTISLMVAGVTAFGLIVGVDVVTRANLNALCLLAVFISALVWGRGPGLFCCFISSISFDYFFVLPRYTFAITDSKYLITFAVYFIVALLTSELAYRSHSLMHEQLARANAEVERSRAESARDQLEAANRAKDELLTRVSHELRSPLTVILGRIQLLQRASGDPQLTARGLLALENSARLLSRLVEDLLEASRAHAGKLRVQLAPTCIGTSVTNAVERASIVAQAKGVTLHAAIDPPCEIRGDGQRIEQIAMNLLSNAIKFTEPGGTVDVRLGQVGGEVQLVVSDTGVGVSAEFLPHLFEPFRQADTGIAHDGLGLGLSIVKHLVDAHGGRIAAASPGRGRGTTFTVGFPLDSRETSGAGELPKS